MFLVFARLGVLSTVIKFQYLRLPPSFYYPVFGSSGGEKKNIQNKHQYFRLNNRVKYQVDKWEKLSCLGIEHITTAPGQANQRSAGQFPV